MLKRFALLACLVTGAGLLATGGALADAGGQGTVTITQHASNVELFPPMSVTNPCNGQSGTLSAIAANSVFHVTFFTNGDEFWVTGTGEGTATLTPSGPSGVSYTGHFAAWFGESSNNKNDVQHDTNTFVLTGSDGSHVVIHMVDHLSTNANGVVTVTFSNFSFSCG